MAKKTGMEEFQDARPLEAEFKIIMNANSTTEVGVEVETKIAAGSKFAWAIVGMRWALEVIAAPNLPMNLGVTAGNDNFFLQLVRGELPAVPIGISRHDHDLIGEDIITRDVSTGVGFETLTWPREVPFMGVTQLPTLHLTCGSSADFTAMSAATNRIVGQILYHLVSAPKARHEDL